MLYLKWLMRIFSIAIFLFSFGGFLAYAIIAPFFGYDFQADVVLNYFTASSVWIVFSYLAWGR